MAELTAQGNGIFSVAGDMNFVTVNTLLAQSKILFSTTEPIILDLAAVKRANSAGLALLLEWQHQAHTTQQPLHIRNAPSAVIDIARISNCIHILNLIV